MCKYVPVAMSQMDMEQKEKPEYISGKNCDKGWDMLKMYTIMNSVERVNTEKCRPLRFDRDAQTVNSSEGRKHYKSHVGKEWEVSVNCALHMPVHTCTCTHVQN